MNQTANTTDPGTAVEETPLDPVAAQLKATRAKLAALAEKRTQRAAVREQDPANQLARAERDLADAEGLAAAEEKEGTEEDGKIGLVKTDLGLIIIRRANPTAYRRHSDAGKTSCVAQEMLVRPCRVYPSVDRFDLIIQELPYVLTACADKVVELAGYQQKDTAGK